MKRFVVVLTALSVLGLSSCTLKSYEIRSIEKATTISLEDFVNLKPLVSDVADDIFVDRNTDVLYFRKGVHGGCCPIMKADGTCLTLTEWKESRE